MIWTYWILSMSMAVTSIARAYPHGNRGHHHGNEVFETQLNSAQAPPYFPGAIIDSDGHYGNRNRLPAITEDPDSNCEMLCKEGTGGTACTCSLPPMPAPIRERVLPETQSATSSICLILCKNGEGGNACMCDWTP